MNSSTLAYFSCSEFRLDRNILNDAHGVCFSAPRYMQENPDNEKGILELKELIAQQVPLLEVALVVHRSRVREDMQPLQEHLDESFTQMRNHVESKYGHREGDPELAHQMAEFPLNQRHSGSSTASINQLSVGSCADDANSSTGTPSYRRTPSSSMVTQRATNAFTVSRAKSATYKTIDDY